MVGIDPALEAAVFALLEHFPVEEEALVGLFYGDGVGGGVAMVDGVEVDGAVAGGGGAGEAAAFGVFDVGVVCEGWSVFGGVVGVEGGGEACGLVDEGAGVCGGGGCEDALEGLAGAGFSFGEGGGGELWEWGGWAAGVWGFVGGGGWVGGGGVYGCGCGCGGVGFL